MFSASSTATWLVTSAAFIGAALLWRAEWTRPDTRRVWWRLVMSGLAVAAVALWALRPVHQISPPVGQSAPAEAIVWTASHDSVHLPGSELAQFALPDAKPPADAHAQWMPDIGTLRRRFPHLTKLLLIGDGLEPAALSNLGAMQVEFTPASATTGVELLRCPRELGLGSDLIVSGRIAGLATGESARFTLEGPDGKATEVTSEVADRAGHAVFAIRTASPAAAGAYTWRLRVRRMAGGEAQTLADETLGVEVRAPDLPRVLILESAPRFDTAQVRHWYEAAGGPMRARLRVGQERYRYFAADGSAAEFGAINGALLAGFDVVLADGRALLSLPAVERDALRDAVEDGLGIIMMADDAVLPPVTIAADRAWLFPWKLQSTETAKDAGDAGSTERLARLRWPGETAGAETPLPTAPFFINPGEGQVTLVADDQSRTLAASAGLGRGTLALTLVRETARWERADDASAFAAYWSWLFSRTARRLDAPTRPMVVDGDNGPVFVDRPVQIAWTGSEGATVRDETGAVTRLAPAQELDEPTRWQALFWPRQVGWYRVDAGGGNMNFYVHPADAWPTLTAARNRAATARYAAFSNDHAAPLKAVVRQPIAAGWWFGLFVVSAGFLWLERRVARV